MKASFREREAQRRVVGEARDAFLKAAAALTEWPVEPQSLPFALLEGAIGMIKLAEADGDDRARKLVLQVLTAAKARGT